MVQLSSLIYLLAASQLVAGQVDLGSGTTFAVLGASSVGSLGTTTLNGNLGSSPNNIITGVPSIVVNAPYASVAASVANQARADVLAAYSKGVALTAGSTITSISGVTLTPGVYKFTGTAALAGKLTLDAQGNSAANFTFQVGGSLTVTATSSVALINGAKASNVFWLVSNAATLAGGSAFAGSIISNGGAITISNVGTTVVTVVNGGLFCLSQAVGVISLNAATVNAPGHSVVPFSSGACYADNIGNAGRTFSNASTASSSMSNDVCQAYCGGLGFAYSGTEYSAECYCSNTAPTTTSSACTMACNGAAAQICGGPNALSVLWNSTLTASITSAVSAYSSFGCYTESTPTRALSAASTTAVSMSVENCLRFCQSGGYAIAGVEYGQECYCGNSILSDGISQGVSVASSQCYYTCRGNPTEFCGGPSLLNIYSTQTTLTVNVPVVTKFTAANANGQCASDYAPGNGGVRTLSGNSTTSSTLTPTTCAAFCSGYTYYGVEYGAECYCGNTIAASSYTATNCTVACGGNSALTCGGGWAMNIYTTGR